MLSTAVPLLDPADERRRTSAVDVDPEAARERALEAEFERDRERRRRIEEEQKWREDQQYMRRLEMWERHERSVVVVTGQCMQAVASASLALLACASAPSTTLPGRLRDVCLQRWVCWACMVWAAQYTVEGTFSVLDDAARSPAEAK